MSEETIETVTQAGRVGPHKESHEPRLLASLHLTDGVTPVSGFLEWNGAEVMGENWGMGHNDVWGDCGAAATDHYNMAKTHDPKQYCRLGRPTFNGVLGTYWAYGLAQGEVGTPPNNPNQPDQGVDNSTWLGFLYKNGIIDGYAEVPLDQLDWFAKTFSGAILGLVIDANQAIQDFQWQPRAPWGAMPGAQDGHDTLHIISHTDGSGALVTWGSVQPFTADFRQQITDAWVIFDKDDPKVNWTALQSALDAIHGVVRPTTAVGAESAPNGFLGGVETDVKSFIQGAEEWAAHEAKRLEGLWKILHRTMGMAIQREATDLILQELKTALKDL